MSAGPHRVAEPPPTECIHKGPPRSGSLLLYSPLFGWPHSPTFYGACASPRVCRCRHRPPARRPPLSLCHVRCLSIASASARNAVARVCREGGARAARNVRIADMNVDVPVSDARRIMVH